MKDYQKHLEKLPADAAECVLISDQATNPEKQELFDVRYRSILTSGDNLRIIGIHGAARDLLRTDGVEGKVGGFDRTATLDAVLRAYIV